MKKLASKIKVPFDSLRETSWSTILIFSGVYCLYTVFINLVIFKSNILEPVSRATYGLISQTLVANLASIILFIFIIILKGGKLSLFDLGFKKNRLAAAAAAILVLWICIQLFNIFSTLIMSGKPIIYSGWNKHGSSIMFGNFIGQLFGNCLLEELAFRGFLLAQICKKLRNRRRNLLAGLVFSQLVFTLIHIPNRILGGMNVLEMLFSLLIVFILGIVFAAVYLFTDNLFLSIGIHTLWNTPLLIFDGYTGLIVVIAGAIIFPVIWGRTFGKSDIRPEVQQMI